MHEIKDCACRIPSSLTFCSDLMGTCARWSLLHTSCCCCPVRPDFLHPIVVAGSGRSRDREGPCLVTAASSALPFRSHVVLDTLIFLCGSFLKSRGSDRSPPAGRVRLSQSSADEAREGNSRVLVSLASILTPRKNTCCWKWAEPCSSGDPQRNKIAEQKLQC